MGALLRKMTRVKAVVGACQVSAGACVWIESGSWIYGLAVVLVLVSHEAVMIAHGLHGEGLMTDKEPAPNYYGPDDDMLWRNRAQARTEGEGE